MRQASKSRPCGLPVAGLRRLCAALAPLLCLGLLLSPARAASGVQVALETARDGETLAAALHVLIPQGFHAYAHTPGDAGRPTTLTLQVDGGPSVPVWYPQGTMQRDFYDTAASVYVYEGQVTLLASLPPDAAGKPYAGELSLLLCSSRQCLPVTEHLSGHVPCVSPALADAAWSAAWLARPTTPPDAGSPAPAQPPQAPAESVDPPHAPLPPPDNFGVRLQPRHVDESMEVTGLGKALLFGLLAGLLLNAMPCVLPVLTFKVSGLLTIRGAPSETLHFRRYNFWFAAGVMTLFSMLALVLGLADLMWGQLYQNQAILLVMMLLVFLMGLSALGVFSLPVLDMRIGTDTRQTRLNAFATGLVSTFLATPCSGPLLGGVLGWAFTQPLPVLMVVFWSVGLGMALPYLLFCLWPDLVRILPHPGAWMQLFERLVGFLLLGTALYLFSLLPAARYIPALTALLALSIYAWLWGRYGGVNAPAHRRRLLALLWLFALPGALFWILRPAPALPVWEDFTPAAFEAKLGARPLLLEVTADWCPNCKFLEATVLTEERLRTLQKTYGMDLMRVDLTEANAYAVRLLEALGSKSIPLTALFPAGDDARRPVVLRDVYGPQTLQHGLRLAFGP